MASKTTLATTGKETAMSHFDYATYNVGGITFVNDDYDRKHDITYYKTREFLNPEDGKGMYLRVGRYGNHDWANCALFYAGADHPIRFTDNVYTDEDLLDFIHDVERDELSGKDVRELLD